MAPQGPLFNGAQAGLISRVGISGPTPEDQFHAGIEAGFLTSVDILIDGAVRAARRGTAR
jgi:hypothetical protein